MKNNTISLQTRILRSLFLLLGLIFVYLNPANGQNCYIRLSDVSGITPTQDQLDSLEYAACRLRDSMPSAFQSAFKVYDFGFYLHNETMVGGYPEAFQKAIDLAQAGSPYYLLFGKQTDKNGVYTRFWVKLKLPTTGKFECLDLISPGFRNNLTDKIKIVTNSTYSKNSFKVSLFHKAEIAGIDSLKNILNRIFSCCNPGNKSPSCSPCLYSPEDIYNFFATNGFSKLPISISVEMTKGKVNNLLDTSQISAKSLQFDDGSNLKVYIDNIKFDLDHCMSTLISSIPANENAKAVFSDNETYCIKDINKYLNELNSDVFGVYVWVHIWKDPDSKQDFMFFKFKFNEPGPIRNLPFSGYAPIEEAINDKIISAYVKNTVIDIYKKNKLQFSVSMTGQEPLGFYDLFNEIINDADGSIPSVGYTKFNGQHNGTTSNLSFVQCKDIFENLSDNKKNQRSYIVGYCLSHEYLHQILRKAFVEIFDWDKYPTYSPELMFRRNEGHVVGAKNLLFPGDGMNGSDSPGFYTSGKQFLLPKDKTTGQPATKFYFSGDYLPKQNFSQITNEWERINYNHKGLIYKFWLYKLVESSSGVSQEDKNWLRKVFTHEIKDYDFSIPW